MFAMFSTDPWLNEESTTGFLPSTKQKFRKTKKINIAASRMPIVLATFTCNSEKITIGNNIIYFLLDAWAGAIL